MSFHVFFSFSSGLKDTIITPKGTLKRILEHVQDIESACGFKKTKYLHNPVHWVNTIPTTNIPNEEYCLKAEEHNRWVRWLYHRFEEWSQSPPLDGEPLTPENANEFWHALIIIEVPPQKWSRDYYRARMEALYEVMRGRETEGITLDAKALTTKQAAAVINLFEQYLDPDDMRLDVPKGRDSLFSSDEYVWCDKCGAIAEDDAEIEIKRCKRGGCPLRKEYDRED